MKAHNPIIALLTDFGADSYYVAQMKGVLLGINPTASIVDVTHSISPRNIRQAAYVLNDCASSFPVGAIFIVVVDPGVGTDRNIICVEIEGRVFVCPDNGLLSVLLKNETKAKIVKVRESFIESSRSRTFHGRDVMAPIAAKISNSTTSVQDTLDQFGGNMDSIHRFDVPVASILNNEIHGQFVYSDSFGNLITNVPATLLSICNVHQCKVHVGDLVFNGIDLTYASGELHQPVALIGSNGSLEIAVNGGSAVDQFGDLVGQEVKIRF